MHPFRSSLGTDFRCAGGRLAVAAAPAAPASLADDLRLFAATFGAGFLFVTIFFA